LVSREYWRTLLVTIQLIGCYRIAGTIFANRLRTGIAEYTPDLDPAIAAAVRNSVSIINMLPESQKGGVIKAYSEALGYTFLLSIPCAFLGTLSSL
jgi:hypothetical protein